MSLKDYRGCSPGYNKRITKKINKSKLEIIAFHAQRQEIPKIKNENEIKVGVFSD